MWVRNNGSIRNLMIFLFKLKVIKSLNFSSRQLPNIKSYLSSDIEEYADRVLARVRNRNG